MTPTNTPEARTVHLTVAHDAAGAVPVTFTDQGAGRATLVLHGGGGPATVAGLAAQLAQDARVITPIHPGWEGTPRPDKLASIADLADAYAALLADLDLRDVLLVGSSIGGWLAAEIALRDPDGRVAGLALVDSTGILVPSEPMRDVFTLPAHDLAQYSFHDPERFYVDPATLTEQQIATRVGNMQTLRAIAGDPYMYDPSLRDRLKDIRVPALVLWGESDRIATPAYGRALAGAIPSAQYLVLPEAGHLPQIEQPAATLAALAEFIKGL